MSNKGTKVAPKISIVMAYYNRRPHLLLTLQSILRSPCHQDAEIIIVDDASVDEHRIEDIPKLFPKLKFKLLRVEPEQKTWFNPCVPFNMGFKEVTGNIVVIQNPECYHLGDILTFAKTHTKDNKYFSYLCLGLNKSITETVLHISNHRTVLSNYYDKHKNDKGSPPWLTHPLWRKAAFHFVASMTKNDLNMVGGFDERFKDGVAYEDVAFMETVRKNKISVIITKPVALHQWHYWDEPNPDTPKLIDKNKNLMIAIRK